MRKETEEAGVAQKTAPAVKLRLPRTIKGVRQRVNRDIRYCFEAEHFKSMLPWSVMECLEFGLSREEMRKLVAELVEERLDEAGIDQLTRDDVTRLLTVESLCNMALDRYVQVYRERILEEANRSVNLV